MAVDLSTNEEDFFRVLRCLNIPVKVNKRGDFVFTHPATTNKMFTGYKLGKAYTRKSVFAKLAKRQRLDLESTKNRKYYTGKLAGIGVMAVYHYDTELNIHEMAEVTAINSKYNIWNNEDYDKRLASIPDGDLEAREDIL